MRHKKTHQYNTVLVLDTNKRQLEPIGLWKARGLLRAKRAAVFRRYPFTIILKVAVPEETEIPTLEVKIDPGSKMTGISLVDCMGLVVFAMQIEHHGQLIKMDLQSRRAIRSGRRGRNTRYRQARYANRTRPEGWLPPSIQSRVDNVMTWVNRLMKFAPVGSISVEIASFDMAKMADPAITGIGYQQGSLYKHSVRQYLLQKHDWTCVYCDSKDGPFEVEHILCRARGGSDKLSNLTLACHKCNKAKDDRLVEEFLRHDPVRLARVLKGTGKGYSDAAAVNSSKTMILKRLKETGLPVEVSDGAQTSFNRDCLGYRKDHWIDAGCIGWSGQSVRLDDHMLILHAKSMGYGNRQVVRTDKFGFPAAKPKSAKTVLTPVGRVKTGDIVHLVCDKGIYMGTYKGRVSAVKPSNSTLSMSIKGNQVWFSQRWVRSIMHQHDGYDYTPNFASSQKQR